MTRVSPHALPMISLTTRFAHWDHHWLLWMPQHPVYESIEALATQPDLARPAIVTVFFTERAAPKKQVYYFNDAHWASSSGD